MNAVNGQCPSISPDNIERLLFHLEDARAYLVRNGAAQRVNDPARAAADQALNAIDTLAGEITGDRQHLWGRVATAGGHDDDVSTAHNREARRHRLLGVRILLRLVRLVE